jgi:hypothetical protein
MKKNQQDKEQWEKKINLLSLALGIIAILMSCQANITSQKANEISQKQIEAQIVVLDVSPDIGFKYRTSGDGDYENVICKFSLRIANFGGAVTAITGYKMDISYLGESIQMNSDGTTLADNKIDKLSDFYDFHVTLGESIPVKIDSFADIEIPATMQFSYKTNQEFLSYSDINANPITLRFTLTLATGKESNSPKVTCAYVK